MLPLLVIALLAPPVRAAKAPPHLGVEAQLQIFKEIKEAERAAFERHRASAYLRPFTRDAVWIRARQAAPSRHDVEVPRARMEPLVKLMFGGPPSPHDKVFFEEPQFNADADPPTVQVRIGRNFFGGRDAIEARYTLRLEGTWKIASVRTWSVEEHQGGADLTFDDAFWTKADQLVDSAGTDTPEELIENLRWARRYAEAFTYTRTLVARPNAPASHWMACAQFALHLGFLDEAREAVRRGLLVDPTADVPALLRGR